MNRVYPTSVPAGGSIPLGVVGTGFKVTDLSGAGLIASYTGEAGSFDIPLVLGREFIAGFEFDELLLTNTTGVDISISLFVGKGRLEDDSLVGSVSIDGGIGVNELAGSRLESLGAIDPLALTTDSWENMSNISALHTIVTPAANVNGIRVAIATIGTGNGRIMFKETAPTTWVDLDAHTLVISGYSGNNYPMQATVKNVLIPAGHGLYAWGNGSGTQYGVVNYEVL